MVNLRKEIEVEKENFKEALWISRFSTFFHIFLRIQAWRITLKPLSNQDFQCLVQFSFSNRVFLKERRKISIELNCSGIFADTFRHDLKIPTGHWREKTEDIASFTIGGLLMRSNGRIYRPMSKCFGRQRPILYIMCGESHRYLLNRLIEGEEMCGTLFFKFIDSEDSIDKISSLCQNYQK